MTSLHPHQFGTGRRRAVVLCLTLVALLAALPQPPVAGAAPAESTSTPGPSSPDAMALGLEQARALALANDEQISQMTAAVAAADADVLAARADRLPQLNLAGTWTRNLQKPVFFLPTEMAAAFGGSTQLEMGGDTDLEGALSLTLNLWTAGRLSAAAGAADAALSATAWQKALVQDAVRYGVDTAYFDVLLAQAQVAIAESAVQSASEALRVTAAALEQGTASRFDRLRAEVELANRQTPLIQARNLEDLALMTLRRRCGLKADTPLHLSDELQPVPAPANAQQLVTAMHAGSAELQALKLQIVAQRQAVSLAKAGRGPVLQLQGQYALQGQWDDDLLPGDDETAGSASVALAVSMPLFDGFAAKADIGRTEADLRSATFELEKVVADRELGVRQARIYLINSLAALEGRRESVALATEAHRLALVRLENGLATPLERLDAELALTDARTQLAEILHNCNTARSALELAVGTHTAPGFDAQEVQR